METAKTTNKSQKHKTFKELLPAVVLTFALCFMMFIYEPVTMYSTNINDIWFDLGMMTPPMLLMFAIFFAALLALITGIYFISRRLSEKLTPYSISLTTMFVIFVATYVQGNFLANSLPALDGTPIDWSVYTTQNVITIAVWVCLAAVGVFCSLKMEFKLRTKFFTVVGALITAMLLVSMITSMIQASAFQPKNGMMATHRNFNNISRDKNFCIFLIDGTEAEAFGKLVDENEEYKKTFEDFTFFPDTLGCYPCTRDTIPLILSGHLNRNEKPFEKFSSESMNDSPFFDELTNRGYDINLYDSDLVWYGKNKKYHIANNDDNADLFNIKFDYYIDEQMKYIGYKYLPYFMKSLSHIETMSFNSVTDKFIWDDQEVYDRIISNPNFKDNGKPMFQFIHTEGAHIPFDLDRNMVRNGTTYPDSYEEKIRGCITMVKAYIDRLKANGVYDNSVIIIMADHGNTALNDSDDMFRRANPLFMVKGINEDHPYQVSDTPVSYLDLMHLYNELLDGKPADELLTSLDPNRPRTFIWYRNFNLESHMVEHVTTSKAWDWEALKEGNTGKEYNLN